MTKNPTYSCLLIDDDDFSRETLEDLLGEIPELDILKSLSESGMAIKHLVTLQPDIVFLDINMPNKSGIDIQKEIIDLQLQTRVIFTTAHEDFVVEAFKNKAFDYLVKPISKTELKETLKRLFKQSITDAPKIPENTRTENAREQEEIIIKNAYGTIILHSDDIFYIEADGSYSNICLIHGKTEVISKNIGKIEHMFPCYQFFKISRSHIINLKYLTKTDRLKKTVTLLCKKQNIQLKVSREKLYDLEHRLQSTVGRQ